MDCSTTLRLQLSYLVRTPKAYLTRKLGEREDREFRRLITQLRKLGHGRREDGPDDDKVPEFYNLSYAGNTAALRRWEINVNVEKNESVAAVVACIDHNRKRLEFGSVITHPDYLFIRPRIDMLLQIATNEVRDRAHAPKWWMPKLHLYLHCPLGQKHFVQDQEGEEEEQDHPTSFPPNPLKLPGVDLMSLTSKRKLSVPYTSNGTRCHFTGMIDHVVFSGDQDDLDVSFMVLRAESYGAVRFWSLLKMMAMIHHARKAVNDLKAQAKDKDKDKSKSRHKETEIYGLATDSREFAFAHIDSKSRYTCWFLIWPKHPGEITAHLLNILEYAGARAKRTVRAQAREATKATSTSASSFETTSQITGCRLYREDEFVHSLLEDSTEDDLD